MKIYIGNLSYQITEPDLQGIFQEFGTVNSVRILTDRETGQPKGFGFVEMENDTEAQAAIDGLNGKAIDNREVTVNEARPQKQNNNRPRRKW